MVLSNKRVTLLCLELLCILEDLVCCSCQTHVVWGRRLLRDLAQRSAKLGVKT